MKLIRIQHSALPAPPTPSAIVNISPPTQIILPLSTPWGDAAPKVEKGEPVKAGQLIAEGGDLSVPSIRSPVAGEVGDIRLWPSHTGTEQLSIIIQTDLGETQHQESTPGEGVPADTGEIFQRVRNGGIREVDPFHWPLPLRISAPQVIADVLEAPPASLRTPIDTLILNGFDRQPGVFVRRSVLAELGDDLCESIPVLQKLSGAQKTVLAVSEDQQLSDQLQEKLSQFDVEVVRCPNKYPLALEPLLVQFVTQKEVPQPENDPRALGIAVIDVISSVQVLEAVKQTALPSALVQVHAPSNGLNQLVRVPVGTPLGELLEAIPQVPAKPAKIILGGLFLGYAQYTFEVPITQEVDSIVFQKAQELNRFANEPCFNCGYCVRHCPMNLLPNELGKYCEYGKFEEAEKKFLFNCIECGICAFVCPAKRPMVQLLRFGKQEISAMRETA